MSIDQSVISYVKNKVTKPKSLNEDHVILQQFRDFNVTSNAIKSKCLILWGWRYYELGKKKKIQTKL